MEIDYSCAGDEDKPAAQEDTSYVPSFSESFFSAHHESSEVPTRVEEPLHTERKFIVFESCRWELLTACKICGQAVGDISSRVMGTLLTVERICDKEHMLQWRSQPLVHGSTAGNILLAAGVPFSGCALAATLRSEKKLLAASRTHQVVSPWIQSILNHLYWVAAMGQGDASPAFLRLKTIVDNVRLLKDIRRLSPEVQTFSLESFHSMLNRFAPKSNAFSADRMQERMRLTVLHFNENAARHQAHTQDGEQWWKIKSSKTRQCHFTVTTVKEDPSYGYVDDLMQCCGALRTFFI
ncbi:hypothetical protein HPB49_023108 [Dermacentor silvarum]|uniref:Uncharacterized protein n=1 Tax=Dermacentor silvarum TaxID=543639 RepID=A0ACB8D0F1_DERSI|nr:hypothetical protein HPB49_023108 [Dermacentor silvarum]